MITGPLVMTQVFVIQDVQYNETTHAVYLLTLMIINDLFFQLLFVSVSWCVGGEGGS